MSKLRFGVIGDIQYTLAEDSGGREYSAAKGRVSAIIDALNNEQLDFVVSLGDLGDGRAKYEVPEILEVFEKSKYPMYIVIGNHDLCERGEAEFVEVTGMEAPFYDFKVKNYRFIVLNAFEESRFTRDEEIRASYFKRLEQNPWLILQPWPGFMHESSWKKLKEMLDNASASSENVIIISHVPMWLPGTAGGDGGDYIARIPEFQRMSDLFDNYSNIRAYIAGHYHHGGTVVHHNILHKTVRSVCNNREPTACIFTADDKKITIRGMGAESDLVHSFYNENITISGTAPAGSYVFTNCGEISEVGEDGRFCLNVACRGKYAIKAVMDGKEDVCVPFITAPARDINIEFVDNPNNKLYVQHTKTSDSIFITDDGVPLGWFDVAGNSFGNTYFSNGMCAFTAKGKVKITARKKPTSLTRQGWYKGDMHARIVSGKNKYIGNTQQSGFMGRAVGYDWLYMSAGFSNDGYPTDAFAVAKKLSDNGFLYRLNQEFPKEQNNHFCNCNVNPPCVQVDSTKISSIELAEKYIWDRGGVTVPIHPFCKNACFNQMYLWLLCAPDKIPCMDFFGISDISKKQAEKFWFMLLEQGYDIGCFASGNAVFDDGSTPDSYEGCTYIYMDNLTEENIKRGIINRQTMVSYYGAALLFSIDDAISGAHIAADGRNHALKVSAFWHANKNGVIRIVRNGEDIKTVSAKFNTDNEAIALEMPISESENSWYLVILETEDGEICSATSPIWFRNDSFTPPMALRMPRPCPEELLRFCSGLIPEDLIKESNFSLFTQMINKYKA